MLWILAAYAVMSLVTFVAYGLDKRAAVHGRRRIPERRLHGLALAGGVPGAIAGRALFRHKTGKLGFTLVLGLIAAIHGAGWIAALVLSTR